MTVADLSIGASTGAPSSGLNAKQVVEEGAHEVWVQATLGSSITTAGKKAGYITPQLKKLLLTFPPAPPPSR